MRKEELTDYDQAIAIGFSPARAARWARYCQMHASAGTTGIGLDEAWLQVKAAESRAAGIRPRPPKRGNGRIKKR